MTADALPKIDRPADEVTFEVERPGRHDELYVRMVDLGPDPPTAEHLHRKIGQDWQQLRLRMDWDEGWSISFGWSEPQAWTVDVLRAALDKRPMRRTSEHREGDGVRVRKMRTGWVQVTLARDTGPPEWPRPRVSVSAGRKDGGVELAVMAGWRRTARHLIVTVGRKAGR